MIVTSKLGYLNWVKQRFHQLSIRQKIFCGYGLALGIAVLGTTAGLVIGDRYFQQARQQMILADEEGSLLSSLQGELLEIQIHQQEIVPAILAFYTSQIIAYPINAVTNIAQRVTQEANFDLQAPVTTQDEN